MKLPKFLRTIPGPPREPRLPDTVLPPQDGDQGAVKDADAAWWEPATKAPASEIGSPRAARTLMAGDEVWDGVAWVEIAKPPVPFIMTDTWTGQKFSCMRIELADGTVLEPVYEAELLSRDAEEQAWAAAGGAL